MIKNCYCNLELTYTCLSGWLCIALQMLYCFGLVMQICKIRCDILLTACIATEAEMLSVESNWNTQLTCRPNCLTGGFCRKLKACYISHLAACSRFCWDMHFSSVATCLSFTYCYSCHAWFSNPMTWNAENLFTL